MFLQLLAIFVAITTPIFAANRSFTIDYDNDCFRKDGEEYRYIAGSAHYFRIPEAYWDDRLAKMKAGGLNAVEFYIPWNLHEPVSGRYEFSGIYNVTKFLQLVQKNQLDVILRAGPYTCGELDNGGLPWWMLKIPDIKMRTMDKRYLVYVTRWYRKLFPLIIPFLYRNNGPIIMVQVENEYGSYYACDRDYMLFLRDLFRNVLGDDVVLFTVDGGAESFLKCGYTPGLYPTVDFGCGAGSVKQGFEAQRKYAPKGPLVNTEFYPGWLDVWGVPHQTVATDGILQTMRLMYGQNASFNFYMYHGGTSFGYTGGSVGVNPVTTSYDYDAPLTESGDVTPKYLAIRSLIENLTETSIDLPIPEPGPKRGYGSVQAVFVAKLLDLLQFWDRRKVRMQYPLTFEQLDVGFGYVLYETDIVADVISANLSLDGLRDRGYVMIDGRPEGILSQTENKFQLQLTAKTGQRLQVLVENNGRHTQGGSDPKGLVSNVTLDDRTLTNWTMTPIQLEDLTALLNKGNLQSVLKTLNGSQTAKDVFSPSFYYGKFSVDDEPADTFWHPGNWSKGQVFINDFNLGRYWPSLGPQVTLYVPKPVLKRVNRVLVFELEKPGNCENGYQNCQFSFIDYPILNETVSGLIKPPPLPMFMRFPACTMV